MDRLQNAEVYFRRNGLRPAAALATWALAEAHFLRGDAGAASDLLQALTPASDLTAALKPLLAVRLPLDRASAPRERQRAADFLAEAGAALVQNRLPEWTQRLEALRAAFQSEGEGLAKVERQRRELARALPEEAREAFLHCE